jgi:hypothetical protein
MKAKSFTKPQSCTSILPICRLIYAAVQSVQTINVPIIPSKMIISWTVSKFEPNHPQDLQAVNICYEHVQECRDFELYPIHRSAFWMVQDFFASKRKFPPTGSWANGNWTVAGFWSRPRRDVRKDAVLDEVARGCNHWIAFNSTIENRVIVICCSREFEWDSGFNKPRNENYPVILGNIVCVRVYWWSGDGVIHDLTDWSSHHLVICGWALSNTDGIWTVIKLFARSLS